MPKKLLFSACSDSSKLSARLRWGHPLLDVIDEEFQLGSPSRSSSSLLPSASSSPASSSERQKRSKQKTKAAAAAAAGAKHAVESSSAPKSPVAALAAALNDIDQRAARGKRYSRSLRGEHRRPSLVAVAPLAPPRPDLSAFADDECLGHTLYHQCQVSLGAYTGCFAKARDDGCVSTEAEGPEAPRAAFTVLKVSRKQDSENLDTDLYYGDRVVLCVLSRSGQREFLSTRNKVSAQPRPEHRGAVSSAASSSSNNNNNSASSSSTVSNLVVEAVEHDFFKDLQDPSSSSGGTGPSKFHPLFAAAASGDSNGLPPPPPPPPTAKELAKMKTSIWTIAHPTRLDIGSDDDVSDPSLPRVPVLHRDSICLEQEWYCLCAGPSSTSRLRVKERPNSKRLHTVAVDRKLFDTAAARRRRQQQKKELNPEEGVWVAHMLPEREINAMASDPAVKAAALSSKARDRLKMSRWHRHKRNDALFAWDVTQTLNKHSQRTQKAIVDRLEQERNGTPHAFFADRHKQAAARNWKPETLHFDSNGQVITARRRPATAVGGAAGAASGASSARGAADASFPGGVAFGSADDEQDILGLVGGAQHRPHTAPASSSPDSTGSGGRRRRGPWDVMAEFDGVRTSPLRHVSRRGTSSRRPPEPRGGGSGGNGDSSGGSPPGAPPGANVMMLDKLLVTRALAQGTAAKSLVSPFVMVQINRQERQEIKVRTEKQTYAVLVIQRRWRRWAGQAGKWRRDFLGEDAIVTLRVKEEARVAREEKARLDEMHALQLQLKKSVSKMLSDGRDEGRGSGAAARPTSAMGAAGGRRSPSNGGGASASQDDGTPRDRRLDRPATALGVRVTPRSPKVRRSPESPQLTDRQQRTLERVCSPTPMLVKLRNRAKAGTRSPPSPHQHRHQQHRHQHQHPHPLRGSLSAPGLVAIDAQRPRTADAALHGGAKPRGSLTQAAGSSHLSHLGSDSKRRPATAAGKLLREKEARKREYTRAAREVRRTARY